MPTNTTNTWINTYLNINPIPGYPEEGSNYARREGKREIRSTKPDVTQAITLAESGFAGVSQMICKHSCLHIL
jgi:hypothetical protein